MSITKKEKIPMPAMPAMFMNDTRAEAFLQRLRAERGEGGTVSREELVQFFSDALQDAKATNQSRVDKLAAELKKLRDGTGEDGADSFALMRRDLGQVQEDLAGLLAGGGGSPGAWDDRDRARQLAHTWWSMVQRRPCHENEVDFEAVAAYGKCWPQWLRDGPAAAPQIQAAMRIGSAPDGGLWAPPEFTTAVLKRIFESSALRPLANVQMLSAGSVQLPIDTDDAVSGGFVHETADRDVTTSPTVGLQEIFLREQYANPEITQRTLDFSPINIEQWLVEKVGDKMARTENDKFLTGDGVQEPRGILSYDVSTDEDPDRDWGTLQVFDSGANGDFPDLSGIAGAKDIDALLNMSLGLKPEFLPRAVWAMRRTTARVIRRVKDGDGRPIWLDSTTEGGRPLLLGHAVHFWEDLPAVASASKSILFADFSRAYGIWDHPTGLRVLQDRVTKKGWVRFFFTKYVGADVRNFDAAKILRFSA